METLGHDYVIRITTDKPLSASVLERLREGVNLPLNSICTAWGEHADTSYDTEAREASARRYVVQYRDAAAFRWEDLDEHRYDVLGDALTACDRLIEDEEVFLPRNRHRVVDLHNGEIVVWKCKALARP